MAKNKNRPSLLAYACIVLVQFYRYVVSGLFGKCCRFEPSCSLYAIEAFKGHGFLKGMPLVIKRVLSCQPFHPGGIDKAP